MKKFKEIFKYPIIILFTIFIGGLSIADYLAPPKTKSELENKFLAQKPTMTVKSVFDNSFSKKYEAYVNDQFIFRDQWISIKSIAELSLGKKQNNSITYGKDGYMFEVIEQFNDKTLTRNSNYLTKFIEQYQDKNLTLSIIPTSYVTLEDKLPYGMIKADVLSYLDSYYKNISNLNNKLSIINGYEALKPYDSEYIYYKTDHHWTTLGAYHWYEEYCNSKGLTAVKLDSLTPNIVENFYGTFFNKAKLVTAKPDFITYYDIPTEHFEFEGNQSKDGFYDFDKFNTRDKYAAFMHGNNGLTYIKSNHNLDKVEGKSSKILVIKDSYANSLIPFLTYNYDEIFVADLRSTPIPLSQLMDEYEIDDVLVIYNFMTFMNDKNFSRLLK